MKDKCVRCQKEEGRTEPGYGREPLNKCWFCGSTICNVCAIKVYFKPTNENIKVCGYCAFFPLRQQSFINMVFRQRKEQNYKVNLS